MFSLLFHFLHPFSKTMTSMFIGKHGSSLIAHDGLTTEFTRARSEAKNQSGAGRRCATTCCAVVGLP